MRDVKLGNKIRGMIKKGAPLEEVRELILQTEAIADCKLIIQDYVDEAVDSLDILQDSPYKQSLIDLTRLNLTRVS
jgi:geranylgeranyl pyrophosphate synthase